MKTHKEMQHPASDSDGPKEEITHTEALLKMNRQGQAKLQTLKKVQE